MNPDVAEAGRRYQFPLGNPGRPKGLKNKSTQWALAILEGTFEEMGGIEAFLKWATANPTQFYTKLWSKLIPARVDVNGIVDMTQLVDRLNEARSRVGLPQIIDVEGTVSAVQAKEPA